MSCEKPNPAAVLEEFKRALRSVLCSKVGGIPLQNLRSDYRRLVGSPLESKELGFPDLRTLLESITDVARMAEGKDGRMTVYGVDESNAHLYLNVTARKALRATPKEGDSPSPRDGFQVFIGNLPFDADSDMVRRELSKMLVPYGEFRPKVYNSDKNRKRFAFFYTTPDLGRRICNELHRAKFLNDKSLIVVPARNGGDAASETLQNAGDSQSNSHQSQMDPSNQQLGSQHLGSGDAGRTESLVPPIPKYPHSSPAGSVHSFHGEPEMPAATPKSSNPGGTPLPSRSPSNVPENAGGRSVHFAVPCHFVDDDDDEYNEEELLEVAEATMLSYYSHHQAEAYHRIIDEDLLSNADNSGIAVELTGFPYSATEGQLMSRMCELHLCIGLRITNNVKTMGPSRAVAWFETLQEALDCCSRPWVIGGQQVTCKLADSCKISTSVFSGDRKVELKSADVMPLMDLAIEMPKALSLSNTGSFVPTLGRSPADFYSSFSRPGTVTSPTAALSMESAIGQSIFRDLSTAADRSGRCDVESDASIFRHFSESDYAGMNSEEQLLQPQKVRRSDMHAMVATQKQFCTGGDPPSRCLYVFKLKELVSERDLHEAFSKYGNIVSVRVTRDLTTGMPKGYGFVYMETIDDAIRVMDAIGGMETGLVIKGSPVLVKFNLDKSDELRSLRPMQSRSNTNVTEASSNLDPSGSATVRRMEENMAKVSLLPSSSENLNQQQQIRPGSPAVPQGSPSTVGPSGSQMPQPSRFTQPCGPQMPLPSRFMQPCGPQMPQPRKHIRPRGLQMQQQTMQPRGPPVDGPHWQRPQFTNPNPGYSGPRMEASGPQLSGPQSQESPSASDSRAKSSPNFGHQLAPAAGSPTVRSGSPAVGPTLSQGLSQVISTCDIQQSEDGRPRTGPANSQKTSPQIGPESGPPSSAPAAISAPAASPRVAPTSEGQRGQQKGKGQQPQLKAAPQWKIPLSDSQGKPRTSETVSTSAADNLLPNPTPQISPAGPKAVSLPPGMRLELLNEMMNDCFPGICLHTAAEFPEVIEFLIVYIEPQDPVYFWAVVRNPADNSAMELLSSLPKLDEIAETLQENCRRACTLYFGEMTRVWIQSTSGENSVVKFVDYGNAESIGHVNIRPLSDKFWRQRPMAQPFRVRSFACGNYVLTDGDVMKYFRASVCKSPSPGLGHVIELESVKPVDVEDGVPVFMVTANKTSVQPTPSGIGSLPPTSTSTTEVPLPPSAQPAAMSQPSTKASAAPPSFFPVQTLPAVSPPPGMKPELLEAMLSTCCPTSRFLRAEDLPNDIVVELLYVEPLAEGFIWVLVVSEQWQTEFQSVMTALLQLPENKDRLDYRSRRGCAEAEGMWNRVWIESIVGASAEVRFIDFGNTEVMPFSSVRRLADDFWQWRPQATPVRVRSRAPGCPALTVGHLQSHFAARVCRPQSPGLGHVIEVESLQLLTGRVDPCLLATVAPADEPPQSSLLQSALPGTLSVHIEAVSQSQSAPLSSQQTVPSFHSQPSPASSLALPTSKPQPASNPPPSARNTSVPIGMKPELLTRMLSSCRPGDGFSRADELPRVIKFNICYFEPQDNTYFWAIISNEDTEDNMVTLLKLLTEFNDLPKIPISGINVSRACSLYDTAWNRVWLQESSDDSAKVIVKFVDYGNSASIDRHNLFELSDKFWQLRPFATPFRARYLAPELGGSLNESMMELGFTAIVSRSQTLDHIIELENVRVDDGTEVTELQLSSAQPTEPPKASADASVTVAKATSQIPDVPKPSITDTLPLPAGMRTELLDRMLVDCCPAAQFVRADEFGETVRVMVWYIEPLDREYFWGWIVDGRLDTEAYALVASVEQFESTTAIGPTDKRACVLYDGAKNRVWIESVVSPSECLVKFIDYGNSDRVDRRSLTRLPDQFWTVRPLAAPFRVRSVAKDDSAMQAGLTDALLGQQLVGVVSRPQPAGNGCRVIELDELRFYVEKESQPEIPEPPPVTVIPERPQEIPALPRPVPVSEAYLPPQPLMHTGISLPASMRTDLLDKMLVDCCPATKFTRTDELGKTVRVMVWYIEPLHGEFFWAWIIDGQGDEISELMSSLVELPPGTALDTANEKRGCALYDGARNRVWIESMASPSECTVKFIDYGNSERVERRSLTRLPDQFWTVRPLAAPFRVRSVAKDDSAMQTGLTDALLGQQLLGVVSRPQPAGNGYVIELENLRLFTGSSDETPAVEVEQPSLNESNFMENNPSAGSGPTVESVPVPPIKPENESVPGSSARPLTVGVVLPVMSSSEISVPVGMRSDLLDRMLSDCCPGSKFIGAGDIPDSVTLALLHIEADDPRFFWAIVVSDRADRDMTVLLNSLCRLPPQMPGIGSLDRRACIHFDGEWNRVWIESLSGDSALVKFVDYGNSATVPRVNLCHLFDVFWDKRPLVLPFLVRSFAPDCAALQHGLTGDHINGRLMAFVCRPQNSALGRVIEVENLRVDE